MAADHDYASPPMRPLSAQTQLVFLLVTGFLLSLAGSSGAVVLCFGADGHVAVEWLGQKPCDSPCDETPAAPDHGATPAELDASSCTDHPIPAASDGTVVRRASDKHLLAITAVMQAISVLVSDAPLPGRFHLDAREQGLFSDPCAALRTIILLV
jgi:hypothetical protein